MPHRAAIKIIQNRHFLTTTPEKSAAAVAAHMAAHHDGVVLVVTADTGRLLGICTERDLVFKVLASGKDARQVPVGEIMSADPACIGPETPFGNALHMMHEGGFRHVPVILPDGRPIGVLSSRDAVGIEAVNFYRELDQRGVLTELL